MFSLLHLGLWELCVFSLRKHMEEFLRLLGILERVLKGVIPEAVELVFTALLPNPPLLVLRGLCGWGPRFLCSQGQRFQARPQNVKVIAKEEQLMSQRD
jgi:hypothetical protein